MNINPDPVSTWIQNGGSIATAVGVLIALGIAVWWEPKKARDERKARAKQATDESKRHTEQLAEMRRAEDDRLAAQARRIIATTVKADVLVPNTWHVKIENTSTDAISSLCVNAIAHDKDGNIVPDGCRQARPDAKASIADAAATTVLHAHQAMMQRVREDFDQFIAHAANTYNSYGVPEAQIMLQAFSAGMAQLNLDESSAAALKEQVKQAIALQIGDSWPSRLAPGQAAIIAYQTNSAEYTLEPEMYFADFGGYVWHRTDLKLERISEPEPELESIAVREPMQERRRRNP
ncbi:hypothetical protein, partial [Mycobacterium marinum]